MIRCDIMNPTQGGRVIFDGMGGKEPILIASGATVTGVVLAEHVVAALRDKAKSDDPKNPVALRITEREQVGQPFEPLDPRKEPDLGALIAEQVSAQVSAALKRDFAAMAGSGAPVIASQQGRKS